MTCQIYYSAPAKKAPAKKESSSEEDSSDEEEEKPKAKAGKIFIQNAEVLSGLELIQLDCEVDEEFHTLKFVIICNLLGVFLKSFSCFLQVVGSYIIF